MARKRQKFWLVTYHYRRVQADGAAKQFRNAVIEIDPARWIYQMNKGSPVKYVLIFAHGIDESLYSLLRIEEAFDVQEVAQEKAKQEARTRRLRKRLPP